jgi:uncharacterized ferritin-like protein (DUF455 family)
MELREFAEQILFANTLEEKLRRPDTVTDLDPGPAMLAPSMPGRPVDLRFKPIGSGRNEFPGIHRLDNETDRGRLLHFFANHELLATELMALVLLRFPDAPKPFRQGVLRTLYEEQEHTRMYMDRMQACGIRFGDLPVNGFFWRTVAPMMSPLDFVTGLSLTFEQANLDYCREFAQGFEQVGDTDTAALLGQIYRDEIAHVAHGLKWFRRWKDPRHDDWQAFCRQLKFPLSPNRAKGTVLNVEGRRAAGLDMAFIRELRVHAQSRGRTPSVYWFNPLTEGFLAQGEGFQPIQSQAVLVRDLANLPQFLARQDDVVLVETRPSLDFLDRIQSSGFVLPEFVVMKPGPPHIPPALTGRKLGRLRPWAWGPDSVRQLAPFFAGVRAENQTEANSFNESTALLYSKSWSAQFLDGYLKELESSGPLSSWLCPRSVVGKICSTLESAMETIATLRATGFHRLVAKSSYGLAGRNMIRLWEPSITESQVQWMRRVFESKLELVIEPWLERVLDFSIQLDLTDRGLSCLGFTGLKTDLRGQYQGNWVEPRYPRKLPIPFQQLFPDQPRMFPDVHEFYAQLFCSLEPHLKATAYCGPVGLDAFVYRTNDGSHRIKPVVEMNPRYTMGRLALELMRQTSPGCYGAFQIVRRKKVIEAGFADFLELDAHLKSQHRVIVEGQSVARIRRGALCLNDPVAAQDCLAIWTVGDRSILDMEAFLTKFPDSL